MSYLSSTTSAASHTLDALWLPFTPQTCTGQQSLPAFTTWLILFSLLVFLCVRHQGKCPRHTYFSRHLSTQTFITTIASQLCKIQSLNFTAMRIKAEFQPMSTWYSWVESVGFTLRQDAIELRVLFDKDFQQISLRQHVPPRTQKAPVCISVLQYPGISLKL